MAYRRSRARKRFEAAIQAHLRTISDIEAGSTAAAAVRDLALCGAILLCSAAFESYIEDSMGDWGAAVSSAGLNTDAIPKRLRAFLLIHPTALLAYRHYLATSDEGTFLDRMENQIGRSWYEFAVDN
jgi:hypothetical protein